MHNAANPPTQRPTNWIVPGNVRLIHFSIFRSAYAHAKRIDSIALEVYEHDGKYFTVNGQEVK